MGGINGAKQGQTELREEESVVEARDMGAVLLIGGRMARADSGSIAAVTKRERAGVWP